MHLGFFNALLEEFKVKPPAHMIEFELVRQFSTAVPFASCSHFFYDQPKVLVQLFGGSHLILDQEFERGL